LEDFRLSVQTKGKRGVQEIQKRIFVVRVVFPLTSLKMVNFLGDKENWFVLGFRWGSRWAGSAKNALPVTHKKRFGNELKNGSRE